MVVQKLDVSKPIQLLLKLLVKPELDVPELVHILLKVELDISRRIHLLLKVEVELSNIRQLLCVLELDISNLALGATAPRSSHLCKVLS